MRVYSLLPSSTEIIYALGAEADLAGVGIGCDHPPETAKLPVVQLTRGNAPQDYVAADASPEKVITGQQADLVITQDLCDVCGPVRTEVAHSFQGAQVLSLRPQSLSDVIENIAQVGYAVGRDGAAAKLTAALQSRIEQVRNAATSLAERPRMLCLDWLSPPFAAGYWVAEMIELAGGVPLFARPRERGQRLTWEQVLDADPHILVLMPCGQHLAEALNAFAATVLPARWAELCAVREDRVFAVDGKSYFSVPGPRIVDGLEILSAVVKGTGLDELLDAGCVRVPAKRELANGEFGQSGAQSLGEGTQQGADYLQGFGRRPGGD